MPHPYGSLAALTLLLLPGGHTEQGRPASADNRVTILYDAFGKPSGMQKDWGYSALIEHGGKRILFDTGNDPSCSRRT